MNKGAKNRLNKLLFLRSVRDTMREYPDLFSDVITFAIEGIKLKERDMNGKINLMRLAIGVLRKSDRKRIISKLDKESCELLGLKEDE